MEQDEQWEKEEEEMKTLQGRRPRINRNNITTTVTSPVTIITAVNGSIPVKPANGTGSLNEEAAADNKLNDNTSIIIAVGDAAGNGVGKLEKSVYLNKDKDIESTYGFSGMQYSRVGCSVVEATPGDQELDVTEKNVDIRKISAVIEHQHEENPMDESLSGFSLLASEKSCEEPNTSLKPLKNWSIEKADAMLIKESDQEVTELDVDRILGMQNTHDLYCPNCNSCITKRVILRKRKRKIGNIQHKAKHDKFETKLDIDLDAGPSYSANGKGHETVDICFDGSPTPAVSDDNHDRELDIFRCLSCFSFFIPTGNGIKLFRVFGDSNENEDMQNRRQITATNTNWLFSFFASDKGKTAIEQVIPLAGETHVNTGETTEDVILKPQHDGLKFLVPSMARSLMLEESQIDEKYKMGTRTETLLGQNVHTSSIQGSPSPVQSFCAGELVCNATTQPVEDGKDIVVSSIQGPKLLEKVMNPLEERSDDAVENNYIGGAIQSHSEVDTLPYQNKELDTAEHLNSSSFYDHMLHKNGSDYPLSQLAGGTLVETDKPAIDSTLKPQQGGLKILVPSTAESLMLEKSQIDLNQSDVEIRNETLPDQNGHATSIQGAPFPVQSFCTGRLVNELTTQSWEARKDSVIASTQGSILFEEVMNVAEKSGDDIILTIEGGAVQAAASQRAQSIIFLGETGNLLRTEINGDEQKGAGASEVQGWDILKSIIYGGLVESISSLGVVSSAAGASASTLNVLALGFANLIGGLFIVGHDLRELKNDNSREDSNQINQQVDRYQELLGQRENFILHAAVIVLSFLIFGIVPPVIYGFSFRKSDNRELKLAAVMAGSLLCIILLALGKGHIQRPPKSYIKTVLYYACIGLMASGVSYIVGILIKNLLERFGWFESSSVVAMPFLEMGLVKPARASC